MKHFEADRDWALVAPWWSWPDPADSVGGRLTRPVLQKYDSADLVNTFLADPQKRLKFSDEDLVQQVERVFDVPTVGGRSRLLGALRDATTGKWFRSVRSPRQPALRKLFLETHKRFYLVVCQLHCDAPGFPRVAREKICEAGFVIRRRTTPVTAEQAKAAKPMLKKIATQRAKLQRIDGVVPGLRVAAESQASASAGTVMQAELEVLGKQRGFVQQLLDAEKNRLADWAQLFGVTPALQGWFPTEPAFDHVGQWADVEETPEDVGTEQSFPLYPLIPDPTQAEHAGQFGTLYFGLVPLGSHDHDPQGQPRFDDHSYYELRCWARRHLVAHDDGEPCPCPDQLFWSPPTAPFWIASHFDLAGTAHHPVTIQLPDLNDLAAQTAPVPGASLAKPPGWPQVTNPLPGSGSLSVSGQICSLPIPLITLVAMFLFELFLPVVVLVFGLFWMLLLKFCIPPDISVAAGLTAELDVDMEASLEASLTLEGGISLTDSVHASLVANFADPAAVAKLEADYTPIAIANWELASSRATAPDPNAGLEYEAEVPHP